jgi:hypothetical protein
VGDSVDRFLSVSDREIPVKGDLDTPEQKLARSNEGGEKLKRSYTLDEVWDSVQAANRAAGPWGAVRIEREKAEA